MLESVNSLLAENGFPVTLVVVGTIGLWYMGKNFWTWFTKRDERVWDLVVHQSKANHDELVKALDRLTDKLDKR